MTVLSQATSDVNSGRAFALLKERFPRWDEVAHAPTDEVADAIRPGGIADVKARRIQEILDEVESREGGLDLHRLNDLPDEEVTGYLTSLPGVGPKTAACVLVFAMGRDAFPVDTHVHRIVKRLGWVDPKANAEATHRILEPHIPPELRYDLHVAMIRHGREVCVPRDPFCTRCVVLDFCEAGPRFIADGAAR
jgi:endonuclease-3